MAISVNFAALLGSISVLLATLLGCPRDRVLREAPTYINAPRISSGLNGDAIVIWHESNNDPASGGELFTRILTPGGGWGPTTVISDASGYLQPPAAIAIGTDGTAVAAWRQVIETPSFESQLVVRKFVPGTGWGPRQLLSSAGSEPSLDIAPDGRVHVVFYEYPFFVAKTLAPGEEVWSQTFVLGEANFTGKATLVAVNGSAYASYIAFDTVVLAAYTSGAWQSAAAVSNGRIDGEPQLVKNNGHAALSWTELANGSDSGTQFIQRLTRPLDKFTLPAKGCRVALLPDAGVLAACEIQGSAVPGCFEPRRYGSEQAFYHSLETYRRPVDGDWLTAEIISDVEKRAAGARALSDAKGDVFIVWSSDVPCQADSREVLTRVWSPRDSWDPETILATGSTALVDSTLDGCGTLHSLLQKVDVDYNRTPQVYSVLFAAELSAYSTILGGLNGDGIVSWVRGRMPGD